MTTEHPSAPEQRTITAPVQDVRAEGHTLTGFAALYDVESRDLGGYRETIAPGAFTDVLAGDPDVILTFNHSPDRVLARTRSGTLRLRDDESRGLAFEADLGDGPTAQDVRDMVRRGDVSGASFRFVVASDGERWEGEKRTLTRIGELIDLSLATTPAYDGPRVELRTAPEPVTTEDTNAAQRQENPMNTTDRESGRGLAVEDRTADAPTIESRVLDGLRAVRKGEARSLTTSSADPIAPPELSTFLFDRLRPSSVALASGIRVIPTDRESIQWPRLTADMAPGWYAELDPIVASDPTFATLTATPRKLAARVEMSNEVIDDSDPSILTVLHGHVATILALKLDLAVFEGNQGADPKSIRGLKYTPGIQTIDLGADGAALTDYDAIIEAIGMLQASNVPGPYAAAMNPRTATALALLKAGTALSGQLTAPAGMPAVFTTSQLSTTETKGTSADASSIYVYAPSEVVLVRRQDATIELDRSRLFDQDASELRGKLRADLIVPNPVAVVRIEGVTPI